MNNLLKINFLLIFCLLAFSSCKKERIFDNIAKSNVDVLDRGSILQILEELGQRDFTADLFLKSTQTALGRADRSYELQIFADTDSDFFVNSKEVNIGSSIFSNFSSSGFLRERGGHLESLFYGSPQQLRFVENDGAVLLEKDFHIPEPLDILLDATDFLEINGHPILNRNSSTITWNADPENEIGVLIVVQYNPISNPSTRDQYPNQLVEFIHVPDNGSYSFSSGDVSSLPSSEINVKLRIVRGNYAIEENGEEEYLFTTLTQVKGFAVLQ
ncbi:MAG: hypothetical protein MK105_19805 [Crocinitomicaceae bacterium]|nr:hypothetical protein [Crocinitomicaceae bacterium]